jgi:hypothetical protein
MRLPVGWISKPESWPRSASIWSVDDIENKETVVIGLFGRNSDGVASGGSVLLGSVDLDNSAA